MINLTDSEIQRSYMWVTWLQCHPLYLLWKPATTLQTRSLCVTGNFRKKRKILTIELNVFLSKKSWTEVDKFFLPQSVVTNHAKYLDNNIHSEKRCATDFTSFTNVIASTFSETEREKLLSMIVHPQKTDPF